MLDNETLITAIGLVAALLTTIANIPQAIKSIRSRRTNDVSLWMYIILTAGVALWLVYGLLIRDLPLIFANAFTLLPAVTVLILKIKYR